jgi:hypothetical protein
LSGEIIEELYVAEVLAALDHCFGVVANNLEAQLAAGGTFEEGDFVEGRGVNPFSREHPQMLVDTVELMHITGDDYSNSLIREEMDRSP